MAKREFIALATVTLLATAATAALGDVRREKTGRRPYIVEVGEPYVITLPTLMHEADYMTDMADYLRDYGYPDYVEVQEIEPDWPWATYEVRLYYLRRNLEADFGHVKVSSAMPDLGMSKYLGDISPAKRHQIEVILQARQMPAPPPVLEAPAPPAPAAQAADRATEQSEAAEQAADRTVSIVDKIVESAGRRRAR